MKAPLSWILDHVDVPEGTTTEEITDRLTLTGLKLEAVESPGREITGPLVIGRVLTKEPEPQKNGKTINWCTVDVGDANGTGEPQGIVCGAHNFEPGDLVVTVLPGGVLPGGFEIGARKTYGHLSAGMICSARELGISADHSGILVLPADAPLGEDFKTTYGLDEAVLDLEIETNRPDLLDDSSEHGRISGRAPPGYPPRRHRCGRGASGVRRRSTRRRRLRSRSGRRGRGGAPAVPGCPPPARPRGSFLPF